MRDNLGKSYPDWIKTPNCNLKRVEHNSIQNLKVKNISHKNQIEFDYFLKKKRKSYR